MSGWVVSDAGMAFGGMAPTTKACPKAAAALVGQPWTLSTLPAAYAALNEDMPLPDNVPGGQAQYRRSLPPSFLFKFFVRTCNDLTRQLSLLAGGGRKSFPSLPSGESTRLLLSEASLIPVLSTEHNDSKMNQK